MTEEKRLVARAAKGDTAAFEQLVLRYQKQIYNLALRMVKNREDAQDLAQEAFLKAWNGLETFHFDAAFSTWLYRLASNTCLDFLRSEKHRGSISMTVEDEGIEEQLAVPDPGPTPEEQVLTRETFAQLDAAMAALRTEHRQILTLRITNDLSYIEIADVLGVREGTVKSRLARAREALRKKLLQNGNKVPAGTSIPVEGSDVR